MTKMHWMDETLFLIERYGYARREGSHQGKSSAEWLDLIEAKLEAVSRRLNELSTGPRHDECEWKTRFMELTKIIGDSLGVQWSREDETMAFGYDE